MASCLASSVVVAGDQPGPGQRDDVVDVERPVPARRPSSSWTGSLLAKPVAASTAPAATAAPWPKSGYSTICEVVGRQRADASSAWSMIQRRAVACPGCPDLLPLRSAAVLIPDDALAKTIDGNWP